MKNETSYIEVYARACGHVIAFAAIQHPDGGFGLGLCTENQPGVTPLPDYGTWQTLDKAADYAAAYNDNLDLRPERANEIVLSTWPTDS